MVGIRETAQRNSKGRKKAAEAAIHPRAQDKQLALERVCDGLYVITSPETVGGRHLKTHKPRTSQSGD
eukprot:558351-Prymnesium_polylepis.1